LYLICTRLIGFEMPGRTRNVSSSDTQNSAKVSHCHFGRSVYYL